MKLPKIFYNKFFLSLIIVAFVAGIGLEYKQYSDRKAIDKEIAELQAEESKLLENNQRLEQSINFLSSPEYQEKLARMQLNLKKEGEIVVNFPSDNQVVSNNTSLAPGKSNLIKWWEFIFIN